MSWRRHSCLLRRHPRGRRSLGASPTYCDLEDGSDTSLAPVGSGPIDIAGRVADDASDGEAPVRPVGEAVEYRLLAGGIQFEQHARAHRTAIVSDPIDVA